MWVDTLIVPSQTGKTYATINMSSITGGLCPLCKNVSAVSGIMQCVKILLHGVERNLGVMAWNIPSYSLVSLHNKDTICSYGSFLVNSGPFQLLAMCLCFSSGTGGDQTWPPHSFMGISQVLSRHPPACKRVAYFRCL